MSLLNVQPLIQLTDEFRSSMCRLLKDLCGELGSEYPDLALRFGLPLGLFHSLNRTFDHESYSDWKVVGWIETLNDLVYFLDILQQWHKESERKEFAEQLFAECEDTFFEDSYLDDLFPHGRPRPGGLGTRLIRLCQRLAQDLTQEALLLDPARSVKWCRQRKTRRWVVPGLLRDHFERAEEAGTVPIGTSGERCLPPREVAAGLKRTGGRVRFEIEATRIAVYVGGLRSPLWTDRSGTGEWLWTRDATAIAVETVRGPVTVGPTLVYGRDRQPSRVVATAPVQVARIRRAWSTIREAWPAGQDVLALLTTRIIPLKAKGVVSFSYRHRPGLSFLNCFQRDDLDLMDDLMHENSHHHLNLLLRKHILYHGDHNQQIFYSPWRRSLRPVRGILHATFTFTVGALLFERLSAWGGGQGGAGRWKRARLTVRDLQRARLRCLEEVESVRYSLQDLRYADHHLGWLTGSGRRMVEQLEAAIEMVADRSATFREHVLPSALGAGLRRHVKELEQARNLYGPVRLTRV